MQTSLRLLIALLVVVSPVSGQQRFEMHTDPDSPARFLRVASQDTTVPVIVEFVEEPLHLAQRSSLSAASAEFYRSRFSQFSHDIGRSGPAPLAVPSTVEFYRAFFGVATTVPESMIATLAQLPYVRRVHREREVRAHLEESLGQIRAPDVWTNFGVKGEGVLVGILDSGIDYLHPALGGGLGSDFKVAGGYDFVNSDPDPMDDNGHGTHVAGIVAADGIVIRGVSPKARLLAYKVLDASGRGLERNIIAAIERVVDPNQDGDPRDMADIVNMSLGSDRGDPDDALSRAVDNAVRLGVTFCVSAGNAGAYLPTQGKETNYYYTGMETIGSPGTARLAITVGAVDHDDGLTQFSSKGPSGGTFGVKPDIVAPGDGILSLAPGGGTASKSGTSMASPMVAGVAALLKSGNKNLTPAEIKSALMGSSVHLGLSVMKQGAGRVDAMRAMRTTTFSAQAQLSFGLDDPAQSTFMRSETLMVFNANAISQTYSLTASGAGPGVSLSASPAVFSVSSGGTQEVVVTLAVNNGVVPIVEDDIIIHDGLVNVNGTVDTLRIPWAFVRTSRLLLAFSEPGPAFIGASDITMIGPRSSRYGPKTRWIDPRHLEIAGAPGGMYDFAAYFPSAGTLVTREQVWFEESGTLSFNATDAPHSIVFDARDENGLPFPPSTHVQRSLRVDVRDGVPLYVAFPSGVASLAISGVSTRFRFHPVESYINLKSEKRVVVPQYNSFRGVAGNMILSPASSPYRKQTLRFRVPTGTPQLKLYSDIIDAKTVNGSEYFNTVQIGVDTLDAAGGDASISVALMQPLDPVYSASVAFHVNANDLSTDYLDYSTRYLSVTGDSVMVSLPSQRSPASYVSPDGGVIIFGSGPVHVLNPSYNNSQGTSIQFDPRFRGNVLEDRYTDARVGSYAIFDEAGGQLVRAPLSAPRSPLDVPPGLYRVMIESESFSVSNARGKVTLVNSFDLTRPVADAPIVTSFTVLDGHGRAGDRLTKGDAGILRFSARVQALPEQLPVNDSTRAFYRRHRSTDWNALPVVFAGGNVKGVGAVFLASLTAATMQDTAGIDLRIRLVDISGNASDMIVAPAFAVGPWVDEGTSDVENGAGAPASFSLAQNYPNPFNPSTTIGYTVPVGGGHGSGTKPVRLVVYDLLGREVAVLVNEAKAPGRYEARFDGTGLASGVYFYSLIAERYAETRKLLLLY